MRLMQDTVSRLTEMVADQRIHMNHQQLRNRQGRSSHETESELDIESTDETVASRGRSRMNVSIKLPPFTGRESWNVWFNRFEKIAIPQHWSSDRKLDEMLPRLQGPAGEFAFGQLSRRTRSNYYELSNELNNRFKVIETTKSFKTQFSRRQQKHGEKVEDFALELKRLYDKAYPGRDENTRIEELLRKFLDGVSDEKARFHVEYIKEPNNIDEAVRQMVHFQEMLTVKESRSKEYRYGRIMRNYEKS